MRASQAKTTEVIDSWEHGACQRLLTVVMVSEWRPTPERQTIYAVQYEHKIFKECILRVKVECYRNFIHIKTVMQRMGYMKNQPTQL